DQTAPVPFEADPEGCHKPHAGHYDASHSLLVTRARWECRRHATWSWGVRQRAAQLCVSIKLTASLTVTIFSAASSGISHPNSSSKAITSSTVSRLSAPRSSMKLAFSVTFDSSTPRCSTTIFLTRSATSLIRSYPQWLAGNRLRTKRPGAVGHDGRRPPPDRHLGTASTSESRSGHIACFPGTAN